MKCILSSDDDCRPSKVAVTAKYWQLTDDFHVLGVVYSRLIVSRIVAMATVNKLLVSKSSILYSKFKYLLKYIMAVPDIVS